MAPFYVLFSAIGLAFGSFGNVLLHRLATGESMSGRSHCTSCNKTLSVLDLLPLFSYVWLFARCRECRAHISIRYPLIELGSLCLFVLSLWLHATDPLLALFIAFSLYFLFLIAVFDFQNQLIPDVFTILFTCMAVVTALLSGTFVSGFFGALIALTWFGGQWAVTKGRSIGTGDIFLGLALGILLGVQGTITMLILSYIVGALIVLVLIGFGVLSPKKTKIAFGPFMAIATLLTLLGAGEVYRRLAWGG